MTDPFQALLQSWVEALVRGGVWGAVGGGLLGLLLAGWWLWGRRDRWAGLGRGRAASAWIAGLVSGGWCGMVLGAWLTGMAATSAAWDANQPNVRYLSGGAADGLGALAAVGGAEFDLTAWVRGEIAVSTEELGQGVRRASGDLPHDKPEALREALLEEAGRTATSEEMMRMAVASGALLAWFHQGQLQPEAWLVTAPSPVDREALSGHVAVEVVDALHARIRRYVSALAWALAAGGALPGGAWLAWLSRRSGRADERSV